MKPVYSNPKGHHIHSPFAFELVTSVIFRSSTDAQTNPLRMTNQLEKRMERMLLIRRLVEYFQPETVRVPSAKKEAVELALTGLPEIHMEYFEGNLMSGHTFRNEFVMVDQAVSIPGNIPANDCSSVWFIDNLEIGVKGSFFSSLKNHPKVSQTYALKNCGIVIFNPRYQKQDFIIRGRYSF